MDWNAAGVEIAGNTQSVQKDDSHIGLLDMLHKPAPGSKPPINRFLLILLSDEQYLNRLYNLVKSVKQSGSRICYVCVSKPCKDVLEDLRNNKLDTEFFFFIDVLSSHYSKQKPRKGCVFLDSPKNLDAIRSAIERAIEKNNCTVLLFDTLSSLLIYQESFPILKFAHSLTVEKGENVIKLFLITKENPALEKENKELISDLSMFADRTLDFG
jgi:hypothetical protein